LSSSPVTPPSSESHEAAQNITKQGAGLNLFLGVSKLSTGVMCNSPAMISDAAHSFSDILTDFVTLFTYVASERAVGTKTRSEATIIVAAPRRVAPL